MAIKSPYDNVTPLTNGGDGELLECWDELESILEKCTQEDLRCISRCCDRIASHMAEELSHTITADDFEKRMKGDDGAETPEEEANESFS